MDLGWDELAEGTKYPIPLLRFIVDVAYAYAGLDEEELYRGTVWAYAHEDLDAASANAFVFEEPGSLNVVEISEPRP